MTNLAIRLSEIISEGFEALGEVVNTPGRFISAPFPIYVVTRFITAIVLTFIILVLATSAFIGIFMVTIGALCSDALHRLYKTAKVDWQLHRRKQ